MNARLNGATICAETTPAGTISTGTANGETKGTRTRAAATLHNGTSTQHTGTNAAVQQASTAGSRAYEQALEVRAHVTSMRTEVQDSLLYLAEARQALHSRTIPHSL